MACKSEYGVVKINNRACRIMVLCSLSVLVVVLPIVKPKAAPYQIAVLQALDKVTARVFTLKGTVGQTASFGTLEVLVRYCDKRPPEETPETTAYIEIRERRQGESTHRLFSGWMFGSSPAVSAIEHPVYDVCVVDCIKVSSSE